jgi:hypothetical protein
VDLNPRDFIFAPVITEWVFNLEEAAVVALAGARGVSVVVIGVEAVVGAVVASEEDEAVQVSPKEVMFHH